MLLKQVRRLQKLTANINFLAGDYQVLISEMILVQMFYLFEGAVEAIAAKLVCGARYADGTAPRILHPATTVDIALTNMRTIGRPRPKGILKWNLAKEIKGNVKFVMDLRENFCVSCLNHKTRINEIRIVRNHIAHNNAGTRKEFEKVVSRRLGATPRRLPKAGAFVLRRPTAGITILEEYIATATAIVRDVVKA